MQQQVSDSQMERGRNAVHRAVVVAMLTYKRCESLPEAIDAVLAHTESLFPRAELMVVDNDSEGSARSIVAEYSNRGVQYVNEIKPGIAAARNRAMDEVGPDRLLVFIDDDERPQQDWLKHLVDTFRSQECEAVVGPVISEFDAEPDKWITGGRFFERPRTRTGTRVKAAATNNLLLDLDQVASMNLRFDEKFGITGGSDSLFTMQLHKNGGRIIWCDEAVVTDVVPTARISRSWVLRRSFRFGNSGTRVKLALAESSTARGVVRGRAVVLGCVRIVEGILGLGVGVIFRDIGKKAVGHKFLIRGIGMISGAFGYTYREYQRPTAPAGSS